MINTVDFITPPVDDPYWFGQISAANSISDVYSMGGKPVTALNVVMFPSKHLDMGMLRDILRGGHDKVVEAGACLVGGHTVDDEEPKYGLCVNGIVHPDRVITNAGSQPGDVLILTKPIGSGVLFNAVRSGKLSFKELERDTLPVLATLNGRAMEAALQFDLHACTDITGFGFIGHALEMVLGSQVGMVIHSKEIPVFPEALEYSKLGLVPGGARSNRDFFSCRVQILSDISEVLLDLFYDPQTSGGLLISLPSDRAKELVQTLKKEENIDSAIVGSVVEEPRGKIQIL